MGFSEYPFTPSEYILLNGEKFAPKAGEKNRLPLLYNDAYVDGYILAKVILAAAILANESEGALKLEVVEKGGLFKGKKVLLLQPLKSFINWNAETIESNALNISSLLMDSKRETSVSNMVNSMLADVQKKPWEKLIELVEWGLASSNWLIPVQGDAITAFSTPFICPAKVRDLATSQPAGPVIQVLENCRKNRSEIWQLLMVGIEQGLKNIQT